MTKENKQFAKKLRELRRQKDLSQSGLAEILNIHSTHISRYERGLSKPSAKMLQKLSEVLGVTVDYLLDERGENAIRSNIEDQDLIRRFEQVNAMNNEDKSVIKQLIDAFVMKKKMEALLDEGKK